MQLTQGNKLKHQISGPYQATFIAFPFCGLLEMAHICLFSDSDGTFVTPLAQSVNLCKWASRSSTYITFMHDKG